MWKWPRGDEGKEADLYSRCVWVLCARACALCIYHSITVITFNVTNLILIQLLCLSIVLVNIFCVFITNRLPLLCDVRFRWMHTAWMHGWWWWSLYPRTLYVYWPWLCRLWRRPCPRSTYVLVFPALYPSLFSWDLDVGREFDWVGQCYHTCFHMNNCQKH